LQKGEFADDVVLLARSRDAAYSAIRVYVKLVTPLGLTISFVKNKFMVVGNVVSDEDKYSFAVGDDLIVG